MEQIVQDAVAELEECKVVYFTSLLSAKHHCSQLDIPPAFTKRTGFPSDATCNFVTSMKTLAEPWIVTFQQSSSSAGSAAWSSHGGGYGKFLSDNSVALPTLLVFERLDPTTLVVTIHRNQTSPPKKLPSTIKFEEDPWWNFQKTLRACHTRPASNTRLDIPTSYWRTVDDSKFDVPWYKLSGPKETVMVKSARYYSEKQTFCYFTKGWVDFVALNHLKLGDTILFAEKGDAEFEVRKV